MGNSFSNELWKTDQPEANDSTSTIPVPQTRSTETFLISFGINIFYVYTMELEQSLQKEQMFHSPHYFYIHSNCLLGLKLQFLIRRCRVPKIAHRGKGRETVVESLLYFA